MADRKIAAGCIKKTASSCSLNEITTLTAQGQRLIARGKLAEQKLQQTFHPSSLTEDSFLLFSSLIVFHSFPLMIKDIFFHLKRHNQPCNIL
jgi:hypothetical protein